MIQNPEAIGASPAEGNPQQGQTPNLPPEQIAALRKDPDILNAVSMFMGKPTPLDNIPEPALVELAGMVHKLGVQGTVQMLEQKIPPDLKTKIKSS